MSNPIQKTGDPSPYWTPPEAPKNNQPSLVQFFKTVAYGGLSGLAAVPLLQPMIWLKAQNQEAANKAAEQGKTVLNKPLWEKVTENSKLFLQKVDRFYREARGMGASNSLRFATQTVFEKAPIVYRGVGVMGASFAPTTALQTVSELAFSYYMNPFASATFAGVASTLVVCPSELVMYQQQKTGKNFRLTAAVIYSQFGVKGFYRGALHTGVREGGFTGGYLWLSPVLKKKLQELGVNELAAAFAAGIVSGTFAATITQASDTYKTLLQRDFGYKESFKVFLKERKPFAGLNWRIPMVATATTVVPYVKEKLSAKFDE